ncbi:MAG TPA: hypothetical protein HPP76_12090, partial [Desulfuromonadales bacterium]|nr:hypothetical protein [Desulfuromonadales bacterium]
PEKYLSGRSEKQLQVAVQLPEPIQETVPAAAGLIDLPKEGICINSAVEAFENRLILQALQRTGGNKKEAALLLNLKRTTLIEKLKKKHLAFAED